MTLGSRPAATCFRASSRFSRASFKPISGDTEADPFFFTVYTVFEPPPLTAGRRDFNVQPFGIINLVDLIRGLGCFDPRICQRHWGNSMGIVDSCPYCCPKKIAAVNFTQRHSAARKKPLKGAKKKCRQALNDAWRHLKLLLMAERGRFELPVPFEYTRFPIVLLRPARTPLRVVQRCN